MGFPWAQADSSHAPFAVNTCCSAFSGVGPKEEQYFKSGTSAINPSCFSL
jgi:hypothetical protein